MTWIPPQDREKSVEEGRGSRTALSGPVRRLLFLPLFPPLYSFLVADVPVRPAVRALLHRAALGGGEGRAAAALLADRFDRWARRSGRRTGPPKLGRAAFVV